MSILIDFRKPIRLGVCDTGAAYSEALARAGYLVRDSGMEILKHPGFTCGGKIQKVRLVVVSVSGLGFKDSAPNAAIYAKGLSHGLLSCPAELGPALRLAYKEQPAGEILQVVMDPVMVSESSPRVFVVANCYAHYTLGGDRQMLVGANGSPKCVWPLYDLFVFMRPAL